jgi:hypothetical protein
VIGPGSDRHPLSLLGTRLPPGLTRRVVIIAPHGALVYRAAQWRDALVLIEQGRIEVEHRGGGRSRLECGDVFWLDGLPVRMLRNLEAELAVLVAVSRRLVTRSR